MQIFEALEFLFCGEIPIPISHAFVVESFLFCPAIGRTLPVGSRKLDGQVTEALN